MNIHHTEGVIAWWLSLVNTAALTVILALPGYASEPNLRIETNSDSRRGCRFTESPEGITAEGCSLRQLIGYGWEMDPLLVVGPPWLETERLTLTSKVPTRRSTLREELTRQYQLTVVSERRPFKAWVMRRSSISNSLEAADMSDKENRQEAMWSDYSATIRGGWSMTDLGKLLQRTLRMPVIDETELGGAYKLSVQFNLRDPSAIIRSFRDHLSLELTEEIRDIAVVTVTSRHVPEIVPTVSYQPTPDIVKAIENLPPMSDVVQSYEGRFAPRRQLLKEHPANLFVAMAVQDAIRAYPHLKPDWDWLIEMHRSIPDKLVGQFLQARLLSDIQPKQAESLARSVLSVAPRFHWAQLLLGSILLKQPARQSDAGQHLAAFRAACPENIDDIHLYGSVSNLSLLQSALDQFERILPSRVDDRAFAAYVHLWQLRRRLWERDGDSFRNSVRRDLLRLRAYDRTGSDAWVKAILAGYELIGDEDALGEVRERVIRLHPGTKNH